MDTSGWQRILSEFQAAYAQHGDGGFSILAVEHGKSFRGAWCSFKSAGDVLLRRSGKEIAGIGFMLFVEGHTPEKVWDAWQPLAGRAGAMLGATEIAQTRVLGEEDAQGMWCAFLMRRLCEDGAFVGRYENDDDLARNHVRLGGITELTHLTVLRNPFGASVRAIQGLVSGRDIAAGQDAQSRGREGDGLLQAAEAGALPTAMHGEIRRRYDYDEPLGGQSPRPYMERLFPTGLDEATRNDIEQIAQNPHTVGIDTLRRLTDKWIWELDNIDLTGGDMLDCDEVEYDAWVKGGKSPGKSPPFLWATIAYALYDAILDRGLSGLILDDFIDNVQSDVLIPPIMRCEVRLLALSFSERVCHEWTKAHRDAHAAGQVSAHVQADTNAAPAPGAAKMSPGATATTQPDDGELQIVRNAIAKARTTSGTADDPKASDVVKCAQMNPSRCRRILRLLESQGEYCGFARSRPAKYRTLEP
ncbi:MAG: hypothetical protein PHU85_08110 [Phycisphaerae bacterium]|nr:hypothetical protein [Phycisphaerae bacterium]